MKHVRRQRPLSMMLLGIVAWLAISFCAVLFAIFNSSVVFSNNFPVADTQPFTATSSHCGDDTPSIASERTKKESVGNDDYDEYGECDLYLAPSSIADNENRPAGFGVFTTKPLKKGEYVKPQGEGPTIIIPDLKVNNVQSGMASPVWKKLIFVAPAAGFIMEAFDPKMRNMNSLQLFVDLGALSNFHPYLTNVLYDDVTVYRDDLLNRYEDPGAGAFSYHQGNRWFVTRDVDAGEELFNDYGEAWFFDGEMGETGRNLPHQKDYERAASVLWQGKKLMENDADGPDPAKDFVDVFQEILTSFENIKFAKALRLIPENETEVLDLVQRDAVKEESDIAMALARRSVFNYSTDWIKENGRCLVNIIPKPSTITQAGMGAFAARQIKKGDVVSPAPAMLQIPRQESLDIFRYEIKDNSYRAIGAKPVSKQLLLNYCFGHKESTMVVCPTTSANLINHCGPKVSNGEGHCDERGPNAEVRWAMEFDPETSSWLEKSIEEIASLVNQGRRGLSFEIVALRDIEPGEEIFVDYGPEWERAWESHVANWKPPRGDSSSYISITEMNNDKENWIRTVEELKTNPYPVTVQVACLLHGFYHPCEILHRTDDTTADVFDGGPKRRHTVYDVRAYEFHRGNNQHEVRYRWSYKNSPIRVNLSARYIRFFPGLHSSDQHLHGGFRHYIGVQDDLWPKQWKNLT